MARSIRPIKTLIATRPTAINLKWALDEMRSMLRPLPPAERAAAAYSRAGEIAEEDIAINKGIGRHGLALIEAIAATKKPGERVNVLTHCNAGWLATVDWGTATAPIYLAHERGHAVHVWVDETRPRNQGASLTAWELGHHGVPHTVIPDNTGGHLMQHGMVDLVIVGTDRVTANGDVCNKIGTYLKALAAHDNGVPFYVALPSPTIDFSVDDGIRQIPIEQRAAEEVTHMTGRTADGQDRDRAHRARRLAGRELRFRCHAGAAGDGIDYRARRAQGRSRRASSRISRADRGGGRIAKEEAHAECLDRSRRRCGGRPLCQPRPRSGAQGLYHAPAGPGSAPGAARRRQHLGEDAVADLNGDAVDVLCVKGSGWDMGSIEPAGLPAVRLAPLLKLRAREKLVR